MGNELGLKWTKLGVFYPPNLIDKVEMISKEIRTRIEKIEKSSKESKDEALKQEFIVQYQSENQRIEKRLKKSTMNAKLSYIRQFFQIVSGYFQML